jgi:hypothetical protein
MLAGTLLENNPFRRYEPPKPVSVTPQEVAPPIDPLSKIKFVGIVSQNTQPQAWFFDSLQNREILVPVGEALVVPGFEGQLQQLNQESATFAQSGQVVEIRLGQDLRYAVELLQPTKN